MSAAVWQQTRGAGPGVDETCVPSAVGAAVGVFGDAAG